MSKSNQKGMARNLIFFKKQAAQHLLTPKSKFDFAKSTQAVKTGGRKTLKVKNNNQSSKI